MPDPAATLTDIARVLRPGGTLAVACRTSDTPTAAWIDPDVYRIPSAAQVIEMLHAAGFNQVEHQPGDSSNRDIHCFAARLPARTPMIPPGNPTTDGLLGALRRQTSQPDMAWTCPPVPLAGGFWAEMYVIELTGAPSELDGRLVARIMPDPATAAFETAIQRHLTRCEFPVPAIRCSGRPSGDLDRAWSVMDFATGQPLLVGLSAATALKTAPTLLRRLPDLLAEAAAALHQCTMDGLESELGDRTRQPDIRDFLQRIAAQADLVRRPDLARIADQLGATAPVERVICHGDLHPFNLLVDGNRWTLIDWSTAVIADPHYDLAFTTLMLANPPLGGPAPVRAATRAIGSRLANRFLRTYQHLTGRDVDPDRLAWGRRAHALRALVETATWEANDDLDAHRGHPWLTMGTVLEAQLEPAESLQEIP